MLFWALVSFPIHLVQRFHESFQIILQNSSVLDQFNSRGPKKVSCSCLGPIIHDHDLLLAIPWKVSHSDRRCNRVKVWGDALWICLSIFCRLIFDPPFLHFQPVCVSPESFISVEPIEHLPIDSDVLALWVLDISGVKFNFKFHEFIEVWRVPDLDECVLLAFAVSEFDSPLLDDISFFIYYVLIYIGELSGALWFRHENVSALRHVIHSIVLFLVFVDLCRFVVFQPNREVLGHILSLIYHVYNDLVLRSESRERQLGISHYLFRRCRNFKSLHQLNELDLVRRYLNIQKHLKIRELLWRSTVRCHKMLLLYDVEL